MAAEADVAPVPAPLARGLALVDGVGQAAAWVAAGCLAALTLLMAAEIGTRALSNLTSVFPPTIPVAWEYSSWLMGNAFLFGSAATLRAGGHIRVAALVSALPPPALRLLEIAASAVGLGATLFLASSMTAFALDAFARGQSSVATGALTWPAKAGLALGASILCLQMAARLVRALAGLPPDAPRRAVDLHAD